MSMWADYWRLRAGQRATRRDQRFRERIAAEARAALWLTLRPVVGLWRMVRRTRKAAGTTLRLIAPGPGKSTNTGTRRTPRQPRSSGRWRANNGG